jgi:hypothetical protein
MKLSICIVNWNVAELLEKCLISIRKHPPKYDFEVIVVDNNSNDDSIKMLQEFCPPLLVKGEGLGVRVLSNATNLGFSCANNQAIKESSGEYVLILNPDTEVLPGSLDILTEFLDKNPDAAVVAPKLLNTYESLQRSCMGFPTLGAMAMRQLFIEQLWTGNPYTKKYLMSDFKYDGIAGVDQPMGACLLIRKKVLDEVGLFDEHSFMFFDEVDLCYRIKQSGRKIYFIPDAKIIHHGGSSIKKWGALNLSRHWTRSRNYFFKKHYGTWILRALYLVDFLKFAVILIILAAIITAAKTAIDIHWEAVRPK